MESRSLKLRFESDFDEYQFIQTQIPAKIFLLDQSDRFETKLHIPLHIEICYDDEDKHPAPKQDMISTTPAVPFIDQRNGICSCNIVMNSLSADHQGKRFLIKVSSRDFSAGIKPIYSRPIYTVRYKIKFLKDPVDVWYKDEGGKDSAMTFELGLVDQSDVLVHSKRVHLNVSLGYEDLSEPFKHDHDILQLTSPELAFIGPNGLQTLHARINRVSSHHGGKKFRLIVHPRNLNASHHSDIAPAFSTPILVMSKRTKAKKPSSFSGSQTSEKKAKVEDSNSAVSSIQEQFKDMELHNFSLLDRMKKWSELVLNGIESINLEDVPCDSAVVLRKCSICMKVSEKDSMIESHLSECIITKAKEFKASSTGFSNLQVLPDQIPIQGNQNDIFNNGHLNANQNQMFNQQLVQNPPAEQYRYDNFRELEDGRFVAIDLFENQTVESFLNFEHF